MCCSKCSVLQRKLWVFGIGVFLVLVALILGLTWPAISSSILYSQFMLKVGSLNYENWLETPIPMYAKFYLYNWKNPEEFKYINIKPEFEELGPYVFREIHYRINITWNDDDTVTYWQRRQWFFEESMSGGSLDDVITCVNPISATVASMFKNKSSLEKKFVNYLLNNKGGSLYVTKTAREFLFDGYEDPLLTFVKKLNSPDLNIPYTKFGWFVDRNNSETADGNFTVYTGADDIKKVGMLTEWNSVSHTPYYDGDCGRVNGTSGELWPPQMDDFEPKTFLIPEFCRTVTLQYAKPTEKFGVQGSEYIGTDKIIDNGHKYDENRCYCPSKELSECPPTGVIDIAKCRYDAPAYVSYPHFYLAHPSYAAAVNGMHPNKSIHDFTLSLASNTGIPLDVKARFQVNLLLHKDPKLDIYKDSRDIMMPVFWIAQEVELSEDFASKAKLAVLVEDLGFYIAYGLAGLGGLIIIIGIILELTHSWSRRTHDDQEILHQ